MSDESPPERRGGQARGFMARLKRTSPERLVRHACLLGISSMAMMVWSVLDPEPLPVMMAMIAGQAGAIAAFTFFIAAMLIPRRRTDD